MNWFFQPGMEVVYEFQHTICGIAIDAENNILVANWSNKSIDKVSLNNRRVSITQSTNISSTPYAFAINSENEIYIGTNNGEIKKMTKEGIISSVAGEYGTRGFTDGIGKNARIGVVEGICFDENDNAYFCDYWNNHSIRKLTPEGKITTICGGESGNSDRKGEQAKFNGPKGIVYNPSSKTFYITDCNNKSIRTMTVDGNVNTLCKYSDYLWAIAIDGEGKLYVSTGYSEGELITVDTKGEIKQMNIRMNDCRGIAFNSKGDLFFTSDYKLCVIRNYTKYPPHPILAPITNVNVKEPQIRSKNNNQQTEIEELRRQLANTESKLSTAQSENKELTKKLANTEAKLSTVQSENKELTKKLSITEAQQANTQVEKQKLEDDVKELETQNKSLKIKLQKFEEKETKEYDSKEVLQWLNSINLANLFPILQDIGVKDLKFLKFLDRSDFDGTNIKPLEKRILFESIKDL